MYLGFQKLSALICASKILFVVQNAPRLLISLQRIAIDFFLINDQSV